MTKHDVTYGLPAEVFPRDYKFVNHSLMFWRSKKMPVKVTMDDGQVFCLYVYGIMPSRNKLDLTPVPFDNENRIRLPLERVSTIESGISADDIDKEFKGRLTIPPDYVENQPSKLDFFRICRKAHENEQSIRVYMQDGREIEGTSKGFNACSVNLRDEHGRQIEILFDWVDRILPF